MKVHEDWKSRVRSMWNMVDVQRVVLVIMVAITGELESYGDTD